MGLVLRLVVLGNARVPKTQRPFQSRLPAAAADNLALESSAWDVQTLSHKYCKCVLKVRKLPKHLRYHCRTPCSVSDTLRTVQKS